MPKLANSQPNYQLCGCVESKNVFKEYLPWCFSSIFWKLPVSSRCQSNQLPVANQSASANKRKESDEEVSKFHHPKLNSFSPFYTSSLDMFRLLGLGYFWPHFSNKVSPKQTCLTFLPLFFLPTLWNHVDVTLAFDDDRQIQAHKWSFLSMVWDSSWKIQQSLICSDETLIKRTKRQRT